MKRPTYVGSVEEDRPRTVYLYATSFCNSNCAYCIFRKSNKELPRLHLPLSLIKKTWGNSELLEGCGVVVQGGEFTLHPESVEIMQYFNERGTKLTLLTNAVEVDLAIPLVDLATQVTISLDGPQHDKTRGVPGNLRGVMDLLGFLKSKRIDTTLQMTLGPWNMSRLGQAMNNIDWFIETCKVYDAQPRFNVAADDGLLGIADYENSPTLLSEVAHYIRGAAGKPDNSVIAKSLSSGAHYVTMAAKKKAGNNVPCYSTSIYTTIDADGSVWMCQGLSKEEATLGNIYDQGFDDIWYAGQSKRKDYRTCQACTLSCQLTGDIAYMKQSSRTASS